MLSDNADTKEQTLFGSADATKPRSGYPFEFSQLWKAYPNPKGKVRTLQLCQKMIDMKEATWEDLILAATNYANEVAGKERTYIKHASTFYGRGGYWRDYLEPIRDGSKEHPFLVYARRIKPNG